jgi:hypothetical protein
MSGQKLDAHKTADRKFLMRARTKARVAYEEWGGATNAYLGWVLIQDEATRHREYAWFRATWDPFYDDPEPGKR